MDLLFATYYWQLLFFLCYPFLPAPFSTLFFCNRFAGERKHKHTNLVLKLFLQSYLPVFSGHSCTPLYALLVLRIRRVSEKTVCQISTMGSSLLQGVLSSPLIPPVSQQSQKIMCSICTIAPFACDDGKCIPS